MRREKQVLFRLLIAVSIIVLFCSGIAQADQWAKTYGGEYDDFAYDAQQTIDGGYVVVGSTGVPYEGWDIDAPKAWILKLDGDGNVQWQKTYSSAWDQAFSVKQTADGAYMITGTGAAWLLKLDGAGNVLLQNSVGPGGMFGSYAFSAVQNQTMNGEYIVVGGVPTSFFMYGFLLSNFDASGNILSQTVVQLGGGTCTCRSQIPRVIRNTSDSGFVIAARDAIFTEGDYGTSCSLERNRTVVIKVNGGSGTSQFHKSFAGAGSSTPEDMIQTSDNGYILAGSTRSFPDRNNAWVLKLDSDGNVQWQKIYGRSERSDEALSIHQTSDDGYVVAGYSGVFSEEVDAWILKLDENGNIQWQKTYGGSDWDAARSIQQTFDGGYILVGSTKSFGAGESDIWVLKLDENGNIPGCSAVKTSNLEMNDLNVPGAYTWMGMVPSAYEVHTVNPIVNDSDAMIAQICLTSYIDLCETKHISPLDWMKYFCFKWPSGVGVGIPQRCPPIDDCLDCKYSFSIYEKAMRIPPYLFTIYQELSYLLFSGIEGEVLEDAMNRMVTRFKNAPTGAYYTQKMKDSVMKKIKNSKKISSELLGTLIEAINEMELDLNVPQISKAKIQAGDSSSVDFKGVAWAEFKNIKESGEASLEIKAGLPASIKGLRPGWPVVSYGVDFSGELAKDGYINLSFYIGGRSFRGKLADLRLYEWSGKCYRDITVKLDLQQGVITGRTNKLATYVVMSPAFSGKAKS